MQYLALGQEYQKKKQKKTKKNEKIQSRSFYNTKSH
jgi:hypothetical protein